GAAYSRQGWHRDGGAFREEPIAWPGPLEGSEGAPRTWWLEALDDGRVIAGGEAFAVRQRDGTWRASAQREPADYVACAVRGHEAWAVGWRGSLAHFDGEAWTTLTEEAGRGHHVVGLAAAGDAVLAITEFGLLARGSSGRWRELALPADIAGH